MSGIWLSNSTQIAPGPEAFGWQNTPPYAQRDIPAIIATMPGYQLNGLLAIPEANILCLTPTQLLTPTQSGDYAINTGSGQSQIIDSGTDGATGQQAIALPDASAGQNFDFSSTASLYQNSAFFLKVSLSEPAPGATRSSTTNFVTVLVADGTLPNAANGGVPVALVLPYGMPPYLQRAIPNPDGTNTWFWPEGSENVVFSKNISRSEDLWNAVARTLTIEWIPLPSANCLVVRLGPNLDTLVMRGPNVNTVQGDPAYGSSSVTQSAGQTMSVCAGNLRCYGQNGALSFQFLPMRFPTSGTLLSGLIYLPFVYQGNGFLNLPNSGFPGGTSQTSAFTTVDTTGTIVQYELTLTSEADGSGLAPTTPVVSDIQVLIPGTSAYMTFQGGADLSDNVSEIDERQEVQVVDCPGSGSQCLTIETVVGMNLSNYNAFLTGFGGAHVAVSYARNLILDGVPLSEPVQFLTGWTGHDVKASRCDPMRKYDLVLVDKSWQLKRQSVGVLSYLDGWCHLAAHRYCLNQAGILDDFIDPALQTCDFGADPANCPHYKLPIGLGTSPRLGFHPETKYWEVLCELASYVHGVIYFDVFGIYHLVPYYPTVYGTPLKASFVSNSEQSSDPNYLDVMKDGVTLGVDTKDTRTSIGIFGIDPSQNMVQGTFINADDIYGNGWTAVYHGFRDPAIFVTKLAVDPTFTAMFAWSAFERITMPPLTTTHGAFFLTGMFAFDRFYVTEQNPEDDHGGYVINGTLECTCESVMSRWSALDPEVFGTTVMGRWLANS